VEEEVCEEGRGLTAEYAEHAEKTEKGRGKNNRWRINLTNKPIYGVGNFR
jgi:hypothetical protein